MMADARRLNRGFKSIMQQCSRKVMKIIKGLNEYRETGQLPSIFDEMTASK